MVIVVRFTKKKGSFQLRYFGEKSMDGRFYVKVNVCEKLFAGHVVGFNLSLAQRKEEGKENSFTAKDDCLWLSQSLMKLPRKFLHVQSSPKMS